jgi:hypothetical protein
MSEYHNNYKDPYLREYLRHVAEQNKLKMSKCHFCGAEAKWIVAKKHVILPACRTHSILESEQASQTTFE